MKVLVLHASGLHLGFIGCYGNAWIATPNLDRLAAEGIVFDNHFADRIGQRTSWTGRWQSDAEQLQRLLPSGAVAVAQIACPDTAPADESTPLEQTLDLAVDGLDRLTDQANWLCWVDLPGLQPPWEIAEAFTRPYLAADAEEDDQDEPFEPLPAPRIGPCDADDLVHWERMRCTYAGAVTYLDAGIGLLIDELKKGGQFDDLTIIVSSDRGLALGEHGIVGDWKPWLHDEVVHLPLIMRQPAGRAAGLRIGALTQPVDLAATLRELIGESAPGQDGRSMLPLLRAQLNAIRDYCVSRWQVGEHEEWAIRTMEHAFLLPMKQTDGAFPRQMQLYVKPQDRWEVNNVIQHHLELAEELERRLRAETK